MASPSYVKQHVTVRRRPGMTLKEFFDYHYQVHGQLSAAPKDAPLIYYQTHYFDSAYASPDPGAPYSAFHNDAAELYFRDMQHMLTTFSSEYVRNVVGPDGPNFADTTAQMPIFCREEEVHLPTAGGDDEWAIAEAQRHGGALVAMYYVEGIGRPEDGTELASYLNPLIAKSFSRCARKIVANIRIRDEHGVLKYFRGKEEPGFSVVYCVYLPSIEAIQDFRAAQKVLEGNAAGLIVPETAFVLFGKRAVVLDRTNSIDFDKARQPNMKGLVGSFC